MWCRSHGQEQQLVRWMNTLRSFTPNQSAVSNCRDFLLTSLRRPGQTFQNWGTSRCCQSLYIWQISRYFSYIAQVRWSIFYSTSCKKIDQHSLRVLGWRLFSERNKEFRHTKNKGEKQDSNTYRRYLPSKLAERLYREALCGYRRNRSTTDATFCNLQINYIELSEDICGLWQPRYCICDTLWQSPSLCSNRRTNSLHHYPSAPHCLNLEHF